MRWRLPGSKLFKELELTFGDWVALGDWFEQRRRHQADHARRAARGRARRRHRQADKSGTRPDTIGQLYYAVLVKVRPKTEAERQQVEKAYMGTLFSKVDKDAVEERYARLKTRNIKHFPNPLVGDTELSTAEKAKRGRTASRSARSPSTTPTTSTRSAWRSARAGGRGAAARRGDRHGRVRLPLPDRRVLGQPHAHAALEHRAVLGQEGPGLRAAAR
jgi:hypothetical protein